MSAQLELLNEELKAIEVVGELSVVGGAVMCLALRSRDSTRDIDALFAPTAEIREAADRIACEEGLDPGWLNDAVKGYISPTAEFENFLELDHLRVYVARPEYMLAMKCAAMRLGAEFRDLEDVRYLLRYLNLSTVEGALKVVTRYFPAESLLPKTRLALEELLEG